MKTIRAKFKVTQLNAFAQPGNAEDNKKPGPVQVHLTPVYSTDPDHENKKFWDATPSGKIEMYIQNPVTGRQFVLGGEYYVDFTPAE